MPRTIDSMLASHAAATERRRQGRPVWDRKLDVSGVFHNDALSFEERRDAITAIIRNSAWFKTDPDTSGERDMFDPLVEALENFADSEDVEDFDGWWDEIYDVADRERVWIKTR